MTKLFFLVVSLLLVCNVYSQEYTLYDYSVKMILKSNLTKTDCEKLKEEHDRKIQESIDKINATIGGDHSMQAVSMGRRMAPYQSSCKCIPLSEYNQIKAGQKYTPFVYGKGLNEFFEKVDPKWLEANVPDLTPLRTNFMAMKRYAIPEPPKIAQGREIKPKNGELLADLEDDDELIDAVLPHDLPVRILQAESFELFVILNDISGQDFERLCKKIAAKLEESQKLLPDANFKVILSHSDKDGWKNFRMYMYVTDRQPTPIFTDPENVLIPILPVIKKEENAGSNVDPAKRSQVKDKFSSDILVAPVIKKVEDDDIRISREKHAIEQKLRKMQNTRQYYKDLLATLDKEIKFNQVEVVDNLLGLIKKNVPVDDNVKEIFNAAATEAMNEWREKEGVSESRIENKMADAVDGAVDLFEKGTGILKKAGYGPDKIDVLKGKIPPHRLGIYYAIFRSLPELGKGLGHGAASVTIYFQKREYEKMIEEINRKEQELNQALLSGR